MSEAPPTVDVDLTEEASGTGVVADLVETDEAARPAADEPEFPPGTEVLDGIRTIGGAAFRYTLAMPVALNVASGGVVSQEPVTSIVLHRPTAADMDVFFNARKDALKTLVLRCMRNPTRAGKIYEKLDGADIAALGSLASFLGTPGQKTGR